MVTLDEVIKKAEKKKTKETFEIKDLFTDQEWKVAKNVARIGRAFYDAVDNKKVKGVFKNHVIRKITEIKNVLLPKEYNELQVLKEILGNSQVASQNKLHMFQFNLGMNNEAV